MSEFTQVLERIAERVPELQVVMIMGTDGIPLERLSVRPSPNMEALAAEYTTLLRNTLGVASDTGLGELQDMSVVTDLVTTLLVSVTADYVLFASLGPAAVLGRARHALRVGAMQLAPHLM